MAILIINNATQAIDVTQVEHLDVTSRVITMTSGRKITLSSADFDAVFQAKNG